MGFGRSLATDLATKWSRLQNGEALDLYPAWKIGVLMEKIEASSSNTKSKYNDSDTSEMEMSQVCCL
jgi:hypothetical protein